MTGHRLEPENIVSGFQLMLWGMFKKMVIADRLVPTTTALLETGEDLLLVTHGGPIAVMMNMLFPEEGKNRWQWQPKNGEGYEITLGAARAWRPVPEGGNTDGG